nr:DUF305 domain-containing protein [Deinococcus xianganensis]
MLTGGAFAAGNTFQGLMDSAMMRMHAGMHAATPSGNPDRDFLTMMIPHHQGAVDAAKAELLYGKDPQVRRLAQEILTEQALEIDYMHRLLESRTAALQGQNQP